MKFILFHYIAEPFPFLKNCWRIPCLITLLSCFKSWNNVGVYSVLLHCWKNPKLTFCWRIVSLISLLSNPNFNIVLSYTLSYYIAEQSQFWGIAELYPILERCWGKPCLITLLGCSYFYNVVEVYLVLLHCWAVPNPKTMLAFTLSNNLAEQSQ